MDLEMNSTVRDHVVSYTLNGGSSKTRDEKLEIGLNVGSSLVRHKNESLYDTLLWLKSVATDHYSAKDSSRKNRESRTQILNVRKVLTLSHDEAPWRKRKLNHLLQETARTADQLSEKPNKRISTKRGNCFIDSSVACVMNSDDSEQSNYQMLQTPQSSVWSIKSVDSRTKKGTPTSLSFPPEAWEWSGALGKEVLLSDDTISDSNLSSPRKPFFQAPKQGPIKLLKSGNNDPRKQVRISPCKEFPHGSNLLSSKKSKKCKRPQRVVKSFDFMSDYVPRMAIPVGPRFQADIPDCIGIASRASSSDGNANVNSSAKRLGTLVWPIEDRDAEFSGELIGKGRPSTCLCQSPGSPGCVKLHVSDERVRLKFDISSAFYSWKFDEMGEEVSKSWTPAEEKRFRIVVKMNPVSSDMSFLNPSLKCLPSKSRESILSYYYNVFVLNRMSRQTRLTSTDVDSDDDETNEGVGQSKDVKHHYLIGLR